MSIQSIPLIEDRKLRVKGQRIIVAALIGLAALAYIDWFTGPSVSVTCFYLILVFYLTWYGGWRLGAIVAGLHAVIWLFIDFEWLGHFTPIVFWNFAVRFVTFIGVVWLVRICKKLTGEVESLLAEKTAFLTREVEIRATSEQAIRQLANQLSAAEDVERRRLGQELHDSMGQSLTVLKLRLETIAANLPPGPSAVGAQESIHLLSSIINQARTLTFELYPTMLDQLGLAAALAHYGRQLSQQVTARIDVTETGAGDAAPPAIAGFLFRAVKELIANALKHGKAKEIIVQIRHRGAHVRIVVSDDGMGFAVDQAPKPGLGLPWIHERLHGLGGSMELESSPGHGARIAIDLPLPAGGGQKEELSSHGQSAAG